MPLVEISLAEGRTPERKRALLAAVHQAVVSSLDVPDANVRIVLREVALEHWSSGGKTLAELRGPTPNSAAGQTPDTPPAADPAAAPSDADGP